MRATDALTLSLVALSLWVLFIGGVRTTVAGVLVSVTSASRLMLWAVLVGVVRHLAWRRVALGTRVSESRAMARLRVLFGVPRFIVPDTLSPSEPGRSPRERWRTIVEFLSIALGMTALTIVVTYPQIVSLDKVRDPGDPLFSIWRLAWVAHQLPRDPLHLFDANIFYPAKHTLALSDSILFPGMVCAPLLWLGLSPVKAYNLFFLASFVLAGVTMYGLVRALTRQRLAALVAGVAFAFYPFRFEHYSHFELQLSFWMPLALLALHQAIATGRTRYGLLLGAAFAGQTFSCLYFGLFLVIFLVPMWAVLVGNWRAASRSARPLVVAGILAAVLIAPLAWQYLAARDQFGGRQLWEVATYSAKPVRYLVAHGSNATWGQLKTPFEHLTEQELFPGLLVVVLALIAVWPPLSRSRLAYVVALLVAFDASLGIHGLVYPPLYAYFAPFRSIRVPARLSMLVGLGLSVLAGYGVARWTSAFKRPAARWLLAVTGCALICIEARPVVSFVYPPRPHDIYTWLSAQPPTVIAELPTPPPVPEHYWEDVRYQYLSLVHWHKLVNGNSGIFPLSYVKFSAQMATFPDDASLAMLRGLGAHYVIVHEEFYPDASTYQRVVDASARRPELVEVARATDRGTEARVYELRPQ